MKRLVGYLAMFAGCYGPAFGILAATPPHAPVAELAAYSCQVMARDCSKLGVPVLVWESRICLDVLCLGEAYGVYDGDEKIHLSIAKLRQADPVLTNSIIAHESTHFYDKQLGLLDEFTKDTSCATENNAWRVGNVYVITHGREDLADFTWAQRYECYGSSVDEEDDE